MGDRTDTHPTTPDGRYFVVRGRLWRLSNPSLPENQRQELVGQLMQARRSLRSDQAATQRSETRETINRVKTALGERGPDWWQDGAPDYNRRLVKNTPYREWYANRSSPL